jgi:hypothetical protein
MAARFDPWPDAFVVDTAENIDDELALALARCKDAETPARDA